MNAPEPNGALPQQDEPGSPDAEELVRIPRRHLDQVMELLDGGHERDRRLFEAGFRAGTEAATRGYQSGYDVGFDTGLSARQDTRSFVHGVMRGFEDGSAERRQLAERLLNSRPSEQTTRLPERELEAG